MRKSVGIDVGKEELFVHYRVTGESWVFKNSKKPRKKLLSLIKKLQAKLVVMEVTGNYHRDLVEELDSAGIEMLIANPKRVRDFAKGIGKVAKSDTIDAEVLSWYGEKSEEAATKLPSKKIRMLQDLCSRREQLIEMLTQEKNRLSELPNSYPESAKTCLIQVIGSLKVNLKAIEKESQKLLESDDELKEKSQVLRRTKGVGPVVAMVLLAFMPELGQISKRQIASLSGVAPIIRQSGKFKGQRKIFGGRAAIRSALYMAALSACRFDPRLEEFYQRLLEKGKRTKVAQVACMRKLIIRLNASMKEYLSGEVREVTA